MLIENIKRLYDIFKEPRVNKNQKEKARELIKAELKYLKYECKEDTSKLDIERNKTVNIYTECEDPKYIIAAHYDNPSNILFRPKVYYKRKFYFLTNKVYSIINCYFFSVVIFIAIILTLVALMTGNISFNLMLSCVVLLLVLNVVLLILSVRINLKAQYSADDNTSGVVAVLTLAKQFKLNNIDNVQFIFFDNEELQGRGSSRFIKKFMVDNEKYKNIKVINLDSIGRGAVIHLESSLENIKKFKNEKNIDFRKEFSDICGVKFDLIDKSFSDTKVFTKYGFKSLTLVRCDKTVFHKKIYPDISWIHSPDDIFENIDFKRIEEVIIFVTKYVANTNKTNSN